MQFRPRRITRPTINVTPVVDLIFLLLVFFVVTSTFIEQPSIKLDLPTAKYSESGRIGGLVIVITRDGRVFLQDKLIKIEDTERVLREKASQMGNKTLVLKVDKYVPYGKVIRVLDAAKGAGLKKIVAPTLMEEGGKLIQGIGISK